MPKNTIKKKHYPEPNQDFNFAKSEEEILKFWQENQIFEKSISNRDYSDLEETDSTSPAGCCVKGDCETHQAEGNASGNAQGNAKGNEFVFYDGPPFANGLPHYGHLLTGYIKDIFARYQTMKGKKVERKFGWDTHGLPVEMEVEKELGVSGQIAIKEFGIEKFNQACKTSVMKYAGEWENYVSRQGRWVDFKDGYKTMDVNYMESVLWAFGALYKKGLMYEDLRVVPYSWACQTPLSNFETRMDNAYRRKESKAVTVKFELENTSELLTQVGVKNPDPHQPRIFLLAWTTTPWTLPSNLALAVGKDIDYVAIHSSACHSGESQNPSESNKEIYILAESCLEKYKKEFPEAEIAQKFKGSILLNLKYKPLFPYLSNHEKVKDNKNCFTILHGDFVETGSGTGIVHIAPGFGEDDQVLCKANGIPTLCPVDEGGKFTSEIFDLEYKNKEQETINLSLKGRNVLGYNSKLEHLKDDPNADIIKYLKAIDALFGNPEQYLHDYPHCWRTDTPLIYKAVPSWYVEVTKIRDQMVALNRGLELQTTRLEFRLINDSDLECLHKNILGDEYVRRNHYFMDKEVLSEEDTVKTLQYYKQQLDDFNLPRYMLFEKGSKSFVGIAGWCFYDHNKEGFDKGIIEISYTLTKEGEGKGYATEASQALIQMAFENYPVQKVALATVSKNIASQRIAEKLGFTLIKKTVSQNPKGSKTKDYEEYYYEKSRPQNIKYQPRGINWIPENIRDGQFGKWLEGARDWSISRNRFWGCPVPVWKSNDPTYPRIDVYGSLEDLKKDFGRLPTDQDGKVNLHRPFIDDLTRPNPNDPTGKSQMVRVTDVLDCWFESGSMPFAQAHYPFENKEWFENNFPADFITEYLAQTRGWFYTLMVLSTALFGKPPFKSVICHGTILDENSQKLSKRLKNYADPLEIFAEYGSDAMRFYMISQPVMKGQELRIDKEGKAIRDTLRLAIKPLINAYNFFCLYANSDGIKAERLSGSASISNIMDRYILAKLKSAVLAIDQAMQKYDTPTACNEFVGFFEVLNNWYIRRSRNRFWKSEIDEDKKQAYNTLYTVLLTMCEASAPLLPFTTEKVWKDLMPNPISG